MTRTVRTYTYCFVVAALGLAASQAVQADQGVSLGWNPSASPDVAGYALYYGTASGAYSARLDAGTNLVTTVSGLLAGQTYYFAVTAYAAGGAESVPSNEASFTTPMLTPFSLFVDEGMTLTITNSGAGLNLPPGLLSFQLNNPPTGALVDPVTGVFTWTPTHDQAPSTNVISLTVSAGVGSPVISASSTFTVVVVGSNSPPVFQAPDQNNGTLTLSWTATVGQQFQLQYQTNMGQTNWINLGSPITATNALTTALDTIGPDPQRFYRLVVVP